MVPPQGRETPLERIRRAAWEMLYEDDVGVALKYSDGFA